MDPYSRNSANELFQAQSHLYKHVFNFVSSMSLKAALELDIPEIIHNHGAPITLQDLVSALRIGPEKTTFLFRLMRLLVHSGIFAVAEVQTNQVEERYELTASSRLLIKDNATSLSAFVKAMHDKAIVNPWQCLGDWFSSQEKKTTPFEIANGMSFWGYGNQNDDFNKIFNEAMASDSGMMNLVVGDCREVFEGLDSLVDVGGGTGTVGRIICESFPQLKCTVFDLPHVVTNLKDDANLKFVGGDMFEFIPSADAVLLKLTLHAWNDEDCLKILKKCREAISNKGEGGKVIIIDIVINEKKDEHEMTEAKLFFDLLMMVVVTGRERSEKEWEKLFLEAGFSRYNIIPIFGLRSLIEVYP